MSHALSNLIVFFDTFVKNILLVDAYHVNCVLIIINIIVLDNHRFVTPI